MSASREKRERRKDLDGALTQKQIKDRKEAAAHKRKVVAYWIIGVVVVIAVAALLTWNSGIFQRRAVAATVGDRQYTAAEVSYYYYQTRNYEYQMAQYGLSSYDPSIADSEQVYDEESGKTYQEYFQEQALESLKQLTALLDAAGAEGYTLSADGQAAIDSTYETIDQVCSQYSITRSSYLTQTYGKYMTEGVFKTVLTNAVLADDYSSSHQDSLTYEQADLDAYYDENSGSLDSYDFRTFFISGTPETKTDEDGNTIEATDEETEAAMEEARTKAEQAVEEITSADDREAAFIEAAPKYVAEASRESYEEDPDYSLNSGTLGSSISSTYSEWLMDEAREAGDVTTIESSTGVYVVLFLDRYLDESNTVDIRHILIKAELADEDDPLTEDVDETSVPTQEALDAAKAEAESLLAQWESGDKTAESFGALANEYSDDTGSNTNGGLYNNVREGQMFDAFNEWIFDPARQSGDTTVLENPQSGQQGWHVIYFQGEAAPYWQAVAESALRSNDQSAWLEDLLANYEATAESGMANVG